MSVKDAGSLIRRQNCRHANVLACVLLWSAATLTACGGGGGAGGSSREAAPPRLVSAVATSQTTILASFSTAMGETTNDPSHYTLPGATITEGDLSEHKTEVLLTTQPLTSGTSYTLTVTDVTDAGGNLIDAAANSARVEAFPAPAADAAQPEMLGATATSPNTILVTFSEPMAGETGNPVHYRLAPGVTIMEAQLSQANTQVLLTTQALTAGTNYTVTASGVTDRNGNAISPSANSANAVLAPPTQSSNPPKIIAAVPTSPTTLLITFSAPVTDNAGDASNYEIATEGMTALAVVGAQLNSFDTQVALTTLTQAAGEQYTVTISNVTDKTSRPLDPNTISFQGGTFPSTDLPRVVGAASTGNREVLVSFSKPMGSSATRPENYVIVQTNVNPEAGALLVTAATFESDDDHATVRLTTRSQNELTYTLTVVNVRDLSGNPLAPKQVVAGTVVDPSSATFPGTPPGCGPLLCTNGHQGLNGMRCAADGDHPYELCTTDGDCGTSTPCGGGFCATDDDCAESGACERAQPCTLADADGDQLPDNEEQRGWVVRVTLADGTVITRDVTSDPLVPDTDGDGLDDALERSLGTDPRSVDTDGDGLTDAEEYNIIFSDPANQDTDGDGISDQLEVEFFKTDALVADSDGDGYTDGQELFETNRDPRIADLPAPDFSVGEARLQIDEQFTYTNEQGQTETVDSNTQTSLVTEETRSTSSFTDIMGGFHANVIGGVVPSACGMCGDDALFSAELIGDVGGFFQKEDSTTTESALAAQRAFQSSLDKAQSFSTDSTVTRSVVGGRMEVAVSLQNRGDVAFTLSNMEITALTTDPDDSTQFVPVATLLPDSQQQSGNPATFNIGPGETRGPILFSNAQLFPHLVEDLMKSPRGLVFRVANYDVTTEDGRNFAFGMQAVRELTANVTVDFGDGTVKQANAITAGVLNRPRDELRCAPFGDHPDQACQSDMDCGSSIPCDGGKVIGGFSEFGGTGKPVGVPLDFVLRDILQLRKTRPPVILAGPNGVADSTASGDDVQVVPAGPATLPPNTVVIAPGRNGVLDTKPGGDDLNSQAAAIVAGPNGVVDTMAQGNDVQVVAVGTAKLPSDAVVVAPGSSGLLETTPGGDDVITGPDGVVAGLDGIVQSVAQGDDVQLVPVGTTGVPEDTVAIAAGHNGILDTKVLGDDVADVVTGYEVSKTCNADTPSAILAGANGIAETTVESGFCTTAFPPHFFGEHGCTQDADCGQNPNNPDIFGVCSSDVQVEAPNTMGLDPNTVVALPRNSDGTPNQHGSFTRSVPPVSSDDVYVGPGIPCTSNADCSITVPSQTVDGEPLVPGTFSGACSGPQVVVRVDNRRNGQFRRFWQLLSNRTDLQSDFGQILVRAGDAINLTFVQDADRDGLIAQEEFLHHSSDFKKDTDRDGLDDFEEVRLGWEVGVVGQPLRRVFPDPSNPDSDGDGLRDDEEQDLRIVQCACDALGPRTLLGSGNLLRFALGNEEGGKPCTSNADCDGLTPGVCRDTVHCTAAGFLDGMPCPACDDDQTLHRSDPGLRDTDGDRVPDSDEVFGYRTGAGIVSVPMVAAGGFPSVAGVILSSDEGAEKGVAQTRACEDNYCVEDQGLPLCPIGQLPSSACRVPCQTDGDCPSHACIHPELCDDVQVVPAGTGGLSPNTVVVAPGAFGAYRGSLFTDRTMPDRLVGAQSSDIVNGVRVATVAKEGKLVSVSRAQADDGEVVGYGQSAAELGGLACVDGSAFATPSRPGLAQRFTMCAVIKPGPDGEIESIAGTSTDPDIQPNLLVPAGSGQKLEYSDPLNPDTDADEVIDGIERILGSSPNDPADIGTSGDTDRDGLSDNIERNGWIVSVDTSSPRPVAANPFVPDTDGDGLPDYAEFHMPCRTNPGECPTDPTNPDTDGDGISDFDELSADQFANLERVNGFFPAYHVDGSGSKKYGTDPNLTDTDGDGLSDYEELFTGLVVVVPGAGTATHVFSDPNSEDTDNDRLNDHDEYNAACFTDTTKTCPTDPTNPDTDGDGRVDGAECSTGESCESDPLVPDVLVRVSFPFIRINDGPQAQAVPLGYDLRAQRSDEPFNALETHVISTEVCTNPQCLYPCPALIGCVATHNFTVPQNENGSCPRPPEILLFSNDPNQSGEPLTAYGFLYGCGACAYSNRAEIDTASAGSFSANPPLTYTNSRTILLHDGQGIFVSGEVSYLSACTPFVGKLLNCRMHFEKSYSYNQLAGKQFISEAINLNHVPEFTDQAHPCDVDVLLQIESGD